MLELGRRCHSELLRQVWGLAEAGAEAFPVSTEDGMAFGWHGAALIAYGRHGCNTGRWKQLLVVKLFSAS